MIIAVTDSLDSSLQPVSLPSPLTIEEMPKHGARPRAAFLTSMRNNALKGIRDQSLLLESTWASVLHGIFEVLAYCLYGSTYSVASARASAASVKSWIFFELEEQGLRQDTEDIRKLVRERVRHGGNRRKAQWPGGRQRAPADLADCQAGVGRQHYSLLPQ